MDVGTAVVFVAVGAACFYFVLHQEKVQSPLALKVSCISLGASLVFSSLLSLPRDPIASLDAMSRGAFVRHLFIGIAVVSLMYVVYPMKPGLAGSRQPPERRDEE